MAYVLHKTQTDASEAEFFDVLIVLKQYRVKSFAAVRDIAAKAVASCGFLAARWINDLLKSQPAYF